MDARAPLRPARHAQASLPPDRRRRAVGCGPGRRRWRLSTAPSPSNWNAPLRGFLAWRLTERPGGPRAHPRAGRRRRARAGSAARPAHARGTGQAPAPSAGAGPARAAGALGLPLCVRPVHLPHHPERKTGGRRAAPGAGLHRPLRRSARRPAHARRRRQRLRAARPRRGLPGRAPLPFRRRPRGCAGAAYMGERRRHERRAPDLPDGRVRQRRTPCCVCARSCAPTNPSSSRIATSPATAAQRDALRLSEDEFSRREALAVSRCVGPATACATASAWKWMPGCRRRGGHRQRFARTPASGACALSGADRRGNRVDPRC